MKRVNDLDEAVKLAAASAMFDGRTYVVCRRQEPDADPERPVEMGVTDYMGWQKISRKYGWEGLLKIGPALPVRKPRVVNTNEGSTEPNG